MTGEFASHKTALENIMKQIHRSMGSVTHDVESVYLYFEKTLLPPIESESYKNNYMMPFLILVTNPCSHIINNGGCTMCGYSNLADFRKCVKGSDVYRQFRRGFEVINKIPHHEMVAIGTAGSFLDPKEVPYDVQGKIIKELNSTNEIHYINIEARAEYVTEKSLERIVEAISDPYKLSIGVGLESSNDLIRELCINKCLDVELFTHALRLMKEYNISPTVYVTIGKPFINDWTNIEDAVESIIFAFQKGADRVVFLRLGVQSNSLVEWLYKNGIYKPISVWSMVEVLKKLPTELRKKVLIANPRLPKHLEIEECPCSQSAVELLNEYKGTLDYKYIEAMDLLFCPHKEAWYKKIDGERVSGLSVTDQISGSYVKLSKAWKDEHGRILLQK